MPSPSPMLMDLPLLLTLQFAQIMRVRSQKIVLKKRPVFPRFKKGY